MTWHTFKTCGGLLSKKHVLLPEGKKSKNKILFTTNFIKNVAIFMYSLILYEYQ